MAALSASDLAAHIAGMIDGDYDDGLEAEVSARAVDNVMYVTLSDEEAGTIAVITATFK